MHDLCQCVDSFVIRLDRQMLCEPRTWAFDTLAPVAGAWA